MPARSICLVTAVLYGAAALPTAHRSTALQLEDVLATIGSCYDAPDTQDLDDCQKWEDDLNDKVDNLNYFGNYFGMTAGLYVSDRCIAPVRVCKMHVRSTRSTLLVPRRGPEDIELLPKRYDVVLGAADAFGVSTRTSFADLLEERGGLPVVNLGKGGIGPETYIDSKNWEHIEPLILNARAVIVNVMAGRSSPNSATEGADYWYFHKDHSMRVLKPEPTYERVRKLMEEGGDDMGKVLMGEKLRRESLKSARESYVELARRVRAADCATPPRVLLMWFSKCELSGCAGLGNYPQFYTNVDYLTNLRVKSPEGWGADGSVVGSLAEAMGAELIDASYAGVDPSPPIRVDACPSCVNNGTATCDIVTFRAQLQDSGRMCGEAAADGCGRVTTGYYADGAAHTHAADVLGEALGPNPELADPTPSACAAPTMLAASPSPEDVSASPAPSSRSGGAGLSWDCDEPPCSDP